MDTGEIRPAVGDTMTVEPSHEAGGALRKREIEQAQLSQIVAEMPRWQRAMALGGEKEVAVYLDLKSPHAYLAVRPTLELAVDFRVRLNFLPYTLSYTTLGVSKTVDADMQRRPVDAAADRKARMYYTTARQYAALQGLPFRAPYRLLDSELANRCFLFARTQHLEVPFVMQVFLEGWGSGWREYELESLAQLRATLSTIGANVSGLESFLGPGGAAGEQLRLYAAEAEASGCVGVPHYVLHDSAQGRELGLFGREHLALIRTKLADDGLARRPDTTPGFSHAWTGPGPEA